MQQVSLCRDRKSGESEIVTFTESSSNTLDALRGEYKHLSRAKAEFILHRAKQKSYEIISPLIKTK